MKKINNKSKRMLEIEEKYNISIEEMLWKKYVDEGKTAITIGKEIGVTPRIINSWLYKAGIYHHRLIL